jgi:hypothetical protein
LIEVMERSTVKEEGRVEGGCVPGAVTTKPVKKEALDDDDGEGEEEAKPKPKWQFKPRAGPAAPGTCFHNQLFFFF